MGHSWAIEIGPGVTGRGSDEGVKDLISDFGNNHDEHDDGEAR
jgi:hypothetical protein